MKPIFEKKSVYMVGGPGGVGKTTLAAAIGIQLARHGHRTIVLTVDPARRLAQALGFAGFESDVQKVTLPDQPEAELYATMLDSQRYFDRVVDRFATSPQQKERLLRHPLYRMTIDHLGGTQEYAAMERLLEFASDPKWDRIVVDTPPTQNAVDLLAAPQRLAEFMDNSVLQWFQNKGDKLYQRFFKQGTRLAMKLLQTVLGGEFLDSLGSFLNELDGMQAGFKSRNLEVIELLKSAKTAFLLVSYPTEVRYHESVAFRETMKKNEIPLAGLILNRLEPEVPATLPDGAGVSAEDSAALSALLAYGHELYEQEQKWVGRFEGAFGGIPTFRVTKRGGDLHDLGSLTLLGETIVS